MADRYTKTKTELIAELEALEGRANKALQRFFKGNCSNAFWTAAVVFFVIGGLTWGVVAGNLMGK